MKQWRGTKKDVDADKDGEIVWKLESFEVVLVHCNLIKKITNTDQEFYLGLFQINN